MDIILASGSASRRSLLAGAGIDATNIKPNIDEDAAKQAFRAENMAIRDQAMRLAELKAMKVSARQPGLVIGGDQMLQLNGAAFDKPVDMAAARSHLEQLSGHTHTLETAIVVCENGAPVWRYLARPQLTVRRLSDAFIDSYLSQAGENILQTVGAYQLENIGAQLFSKIDGDYFSILGLPLLPLLDYCRERGLLDT